MEKNITKILAEYLANARFEDLPEEAVEVTKTHILHTLGTIVAGSRAPGVPQILNCVSQWGAKDESTVLVYGNKLPAPAAALVNAMMGHSFHIDMKDDRRSYPTGVAAVPAALALVEKLGGVSGKELITAVCLGVELGIRISLAIRPPRQLNIKVPKEIQGFIQMLGPFAAAVACSKLLGLNERGIYNALAISCRRAGMHGVVMGIPALNEVLGAGFPSASGIQTALLAAEGFPTPDHDAFQGAHGFFQLFYKEEGDLDLLVSDLGKRHEIVWANPKPFPSHRGTHPGITGVLAILQKTKLKAEEVEEVRIYVEKGRMEFFESERAKRYRPPRLADVQHSHPYLVAVALLKGRLSVEDFTEEAIRDEKVLKLAERVKVLHDPKLELDHGPMVIKPNVVEIVTRDGRIYSERVEYPKGHPNNPLTQDEKLTYFRDLTRFAAKGLATENVEKAISLVSAMEDSQDVSGLCRLLT